MAKRISIGTWAYTYGPYAASPVPFQEVIPKLAELKFDGFELAGYGDHPNPDKWETKDLRQEVREFWESHGMGCSGFVADLWGERIIRSVANLTRQDGHDFMALAAEGFLTPQVTTYPLDEANRALHDLQHGRVNGSAVLVA